MYVYVPLCSFETETARLVPNRLKCTYMYEYMQTCGYETGCYQIWIQIFIVHSFQPQADRSENQLVLSCNFFEMYEGCPKSFEPPYETVELETWYSLHILRHIYDEDLYTPHSDLIFWSWDKGQDIMAPPRIFENFGERWNSKKYDSLI